MRFSHTGASSHTQDFADAWHDIDLEILGIVDDHLKHLRDDAVGRSSTADSGTGVVPGVTYNPEIKGVSLRHRDAWTEGELACKFLDRAKKWITTSR
jgi:hypothetical protein